MKRMKKIVSMLLAVIMVLGMSLTAFASEVPNEGDETTPSVEGEEDTSNDNNEEGQTPEDAASTIKHTYYIYQIFTGDISGEGENAKLSNIRWGENGTGVLGDKVDQSILDELEGAIALTSDTERLDIIKRYAKLPPAEDAKDPVATGEGTEYSGLAQGYYLVMDAPSSLENQPNSAYTLYVVKVVNGTLQFTPKADVPHGNKETYVVNPDGNYEPADKNYGTIGSHVSYVITSEVPDHTNYDYYYFVMNDKLDKGLVFDGASTVTVEMTPSTKVESATKPAIKTTLVQGRDYYVYVGEDAIVGDTEYSFRLAFADIKNYDVGAAITVTYSATVTDEVEKIGVEGNANTWKLQYSNNPNDTYGGKDKPNKPGLPNEETEKVLGETPEEKTLTYLTELDITKYANGTDLTEAKNHLLEGAVFTLSGTSHQVVLTNVEYYREATAEEKENANITKYWKLLATLDGKEQYTSTAPTGTRFEKIGVGTKDTTTGYLYDANREGEEKDKYYVPSSVADYNGKDVYKLVKGNATNYADVNVTYVKDSKTETTVVPVDVSIEMTTGEDGKAYFKGIGAGEYTLTETVTPAGYNTLEPITIVVGFDGTGKVSDGTEKCTWTMKWTQDGTESQLDGSSGVFAQNIINKSGSLLPSTGGIGTTIFTVVGAVLIIGAGILLVVKRRMKSN